MPDDRFLCAGLIRLHVLHHAVREPVYRLAMIEEPARHGCKPSAGTLYPILHGLEERGYRVRDHQAFAERPAVMGAGGADREYFPTMAGEQDLFIADLPDQHRAVGEIGVRNSLGQVGLVRLIGTAM